MTDTITIPLTKGYATVVDAIDADLARLHWTAMVKDDGGIYAIRTSNKRTVYLHRLILERKLGRKLPRRTLTDHVNGRALDNRRGNLREASTLENCRNRRRQRANTSSVTGVWWNQRSSRWEVRIGVDRKQIHLGVFTELADAIAARHAAELLYFKEFSPLLSRKDSAS